MTNSSVKTPSLLLAFVPIIFLVGLLGLNMTLFDDPTGGPNQIALLIAAAVTIVIGIQLGYSWERMQDGMVESIKSALSAVLILLMIGALAGTWMISGVVPAMIYYGLEILNPAIFLVAACIVSAIISLATGSSWSTIATVGVALVGIGTALGMGEGLVAGAIISGAYFGDKMSPLSDTTNLAPAMAGTDLFTHIRYMMYTTFPAMGLALVIFAVFGLQGKDAVVVGDVEKMMLALDATFDLNPLLFLVPAIVIFLIVKKMPALPALFVGTILGGVFAMIFQPEIVQLIAGKTANYAQASFKTLMQAMGGSTQIETGEPMVDNLLGTGGMYGMMNTIWLIVCAMCFGGVMETTGILKRITNTIVSWAKSTGGLIASTVGTCLFFNATASDQYLAIVVPGKMFSETYKERDLAPEVLSRTLEDSGTVTSVLIPWNTCGATQAAALQVATGEYALYCFFNILSPIVTTVYGFMNFKIRRLSDKSQA